MEGDALWEDHAGWWQTTFTEGADPEYEEQILPLAAARLAGFRRVLDVGCGEGQLARRVAAQGSSVVGVDPTGAQVAEAARRAGGAAFAQGRAEDLPFTTGAFDAVVVCLALEHVGPFDRALIEVARVLEPGGRLVLLVVHPFLQSPGSGWMQDVETGEHFWRIGHYLGDQIEFDTVAPGVELSFAYRPLGRYVHALGQAGLLVEDMVEPAPTPAVLAGTGGHREGPEIPRFCCLVARRVGPPSRLT